MRAHFVITLIAFAAADCSMLQAGGMQPDDAGNIGNSYYQTCLVSKNQGIFQNQLLLASDSPSDSTSNAAGEYYPGYKSESTASFLAIFPGFFFHGLGHLYAGDGVTATILLGIEALSLPFVKWLPCVLTGDDLGREKFNYKHVLLIGGVISFLGSWAYDYIHASTAVKNYNNRLRAQIQFHGDQSRTFEVALVFRF